MTKAKTADGKKAPKFYPADDVKPKAVVEFAKNPTKLRASITPGTVLILLAGRYKGSRVVFLKQLESGLLLVSGPFGINGVPLRRVNQVYVIATSTKIDVSSVNVSKFDDAYFKREPVKKDGEMFDTEDKKPELPEHKIADQKTVDAALTKIIDGVDMLKGYLATKFTLTSGVYPHELKF